MLLKPKLDVDPKCRLEVTSIKKKQPLHYKKSDVPKQRSPSYSKQIDVHPKELIFRRFEVNKLHKKTFQITNSGRNTARFEVGQLKVGSEFDFDIRGTKTSLAPGMSATVEVYLNATQVNDKAETLHITVENGRRLKVDLKATRDPPTLTLFGKDFKYLPEENILDVGNYFVGSHNLMDLCVTHQGGDARYFLTSHDTHAKLSDIQLSSISTHKLYLDTFALAPVYFEMKNNTKLIFQLEFSPLSCGVNLDRIVFLCDNSSSQEFTIRGHGVYFTKSHIGFEDVENKENFPVNTEDEDDPSCEYYCDMGTVLTGNAVKGFIIKNLCPTKNNFSYEWRVEPVSCKKRVSIPAENVCITPQQGVFSHNASVAFQVICNVPSEIHQEAGFVVRLYCALPKGAVCYSDFKIVVPNRTNEIDLEKSITSLRESTEDLGLAEENTNVGITSREPSFTIPSDIEDHVCVGSIEFWIDSRRDVAVSINPCYLDFKDPLTLNREIQQYVLVKNECPLTLTCKWTWKRDINKVEVKMKPKSFNLSPFEEKSIDVYIKPVSLESFQMTVFCAFKENVHYMAILKIAGTVTIGEVELDEDIVNYGSVKQGDSIEVAIDFKNNILTQTEWNIFKVRENKQASDPCTDYFSKQVTSNFIQCVENRDSVDTTSSVECKTDNRKKEMDNERCIYTCTNPNISIQGLVVEFKRMAPEMCNHQKHGEKVNKYGNGNNSDSGINTQNNGNRKKSILTRNKSQTPKLIKSNLNPDKTKDMELLFSGYLSKSDVANTHAVWNIQGICPELEYKLLEVRVQDCIRHKLVIADFSPPLVTLQPTVVNIERIGRDEMVTFDVCVENFTRCSWKYCWGQPEKINDTIMKVRLDKPYGTLSPNQTENITVKVEPSIYSTLEEVYLPCFIEKLKEPLRLKIHLKFEELAVTISWNTYDKTKMEFLWPNERLFVEKIEWCGLDVLTMRYRPSSSGSFQTRPHSAQENCTISLSNSVVSMIDFTFGKSVEKDTSIIAETRAEDFEAENVSIMSPSSFIFNVQNDAVPLLYDQYKAIFSEFLHFENVPYKVPVKQIIKINNPTKNLCKFKIQVEYFTPRTNENEDKQYTIPTKRKPSPDWEELLDLHKGLVILVERTEYEITDSDIDVEIWVYANTWGLYMDTLSVQFSSLPVFYIPVSVAIRYPPLRFTQLNCLENDMNPIYEFAPISYGSLTSFLHIPVDNTSGVLLNVFWIVHDRKETHSEQSSLDIVLDTIQSKISEEKKVPEQRNTTNFYIQDSKRLVELEPSNKTRMIAINFNTDLLTPSNKPVHFNGYLSGFVWVDANSVESIGVYREATQLSCQLRAVAGTAKLKFTRTELPDRVFWFQATQILASSQEIHKEKTFIIENLRRYSTTCEFKMDKPFSISQVIIDDTTADVNKSIRIPSRAITRITVRCTMKKQTLEDLIHDAIKTPIVLKKILKVPYNKNISMTSLPLEVHIAMPSILLSTESMKFSTVYVGDTADQVLNVVITNGHKNDIQFPPSLSKPSPFSFTLENNESRTIHTVRIRFCPSKRGYFEEELKFSVYRCSRTLRAFGWGDEDQKYKT